MRLTLTNAYPYPYPEGLTEAEQEAITERCGDYNLEINGVVHFQWLHTVTVEFANSVDFLAYEMKLGWRVWSSCAYVLEAPTSSADGYDHPAVIVNDMAYCGIILTP